jgi:ABC-2 type transport system permease protein
VLADVWLIAKKEYREVVLRQGGARANAINYGLIIAVFSIFMPLQAGLWWVQQPWMLLVWSWLPLFLVSALVADSFAGERERHTLETLLTTALSDRAILFGKIAAAVLYGYGMLLLVMVVSLVTVNIAFGTLRQPLMFKPEVFFGVIVIGLLGTLLVAAIGVMISLRAQTVRQAGQTLSLGILALMFFPGLIFAWIYGMLPEPTQTLILEWASQLDGRVVAATAAVVLLVLDALFLGLAMRRFKRSELSFD